MAEERVPLEIRRAEPEDAAELLSIYAPYVKESWVTFECVPPTVEEGGTHSKVTQLSFTYGA